MHRILMVFFTRYAMGSEPMHTCSFNVKCLRCFLPAFRTFEEVDVISVAPTPKRAYDVERAKKLMSECERHCNFSNPDVKALEDDEDWEDRISK